MNETKGYEPSEEEMELAEAHLSTEERQDRDIRAELKKYQEKIINELLRNKGLRPVVEYSTIIVDQDAGGPIPMIFVNKAYFKVNPEDLAGETPEEEIRHMGDVIIEEHFIGSSDHPPKKITLGGKKVRFNPEKDVTFLNPAAIVRESVVDPDDKSNATFLIDQSGSQ